MHEVEDNEQKLYGGKRDEQTDDRGLGQGDVNQDDFHTGDDRKDHRDLDVEVEFARLGGSDG